MKIMRLRHAKLIVLLVVAVNLILFYYSWKSTIWKRISASFSFGIDESLNGAAAAVAAAQTAAKSPKDRAHNANKHIRKSITIVFRSLYTFDNDLKASIDSILLVVPNIHVLVLLDGVPYPPLLYERNTTADEGGGTVRFLNIGFDVLKRPEELDPLAHIHTKYVLFMPDSVRLSSKNVLQKILREINAVAVAAVAASQAAGGGDGEVEAASKQRFLDATVRRMIIVPFAGNIRSFSSCTQISLDLPHWTVQYTSVNHSEHCDLYLQKHAVLVDVGVLKELPDPFAHPFPEMFYVQAKVAKITKTVFPQSFQDGRRLFVSYHTKQHRMEARRRQFKEMYKKLQIKRIVRRLHRSIAKSDAKDDGGATGGGGANGPHHNNIVLDTQQFASSNFSLPQVTEIDLIGCERTTKSCIGAVYDNRPFYVHIGKHTPPCCLDKLKTTFNHVLEEFENVGIRYWLDNYALSAAIETNQLSPDAYDIDISFNVNDLERSNSMRMAVGTFIDNDGFYWMKATDGNYFRVQFSKMNQVGVNLLPFEISQAGNAVRPSGFFGWKAKEFSADFLHPMSTVVFLGKSIMCPNNVREYLDYKKIKQPTP